MAGVVSRRRNCCCRRTDQRPPIERAREKFLSIGRRRRFWNSGRARCSSEQGDAHRKTRNFRLGEPHQDFPHNSSNIFQTMG
ncbi:unnamed protein product [Macrosiphum euphorbiae]|uniref:Uncharacterized protein n=1 Tax=Macrosiphum euphorbiae TaxID=13131 RepID=A0AAV0XPS3_9HEMI|nr:unnamed protein product [Macrosiphum euphorbiae]